MHKQPACLIVDPVVSPIILCQALLAQDIAPVAILTNTWSDHEWLLARMQGAAFSKVIECYTQQQLDDLPNQLNDYTVLACIYGGDLQTVANTDAITQRFFPQFANGKNSSDRMDKYAMHEACRIHGIKSAQQLHVKSPHLTVTEQETIQKLLPVVVKPSQAAASQGVSICNTLSEVQTALTALLGSVYLATGAVDEVTIQERLLGTEYFVDTVSFAGKHYPCAVFRYQKDNMIYRYAELVDPMSAEGRACIEYVLSALDATGMRHGLAHTELFLTPTGPCLIEINPRVSGAFGAPNKLGKYAYGINQVEFFAKLLKNPLQTAPIATTQPPSYGVFISLQNWTPRIIGKLNVAELKKFPSYRDSQQIKAPGTAMDRPHSLYDLVGVVLLHSSSKEQIQKDTAAILQLEEANQLF